MEGSWLSLLPFVFVIGAALFTKQIIPSLFGALLAAGYLLEPSPFRGLQNTIGYITDNLMDKNNLRTLLYLYTFGGLIRMIQAAGGIKGVVDVVSRRVQSRRTAILLTWGSTMATFSSPAFRIITIAPILKALRKRLRISAKKAGFVLEVTSNPVVALIPIATAFVGYMVSLIDTAARQTGQDVNGYRIFVASIPYNFYSIVLIVIGIYRSFLRKDQDELIKEEVPEELDVLTECQPAYGKDTPCKPWNFVLPILLVVALTLFLSWWDGRGQAQGFWEAFLFSDALGVMLTGLFSGLLFTVLLLYIQKIPVSRQVVQFLEGGGEMMVVMLMLALIWGITSASEDLGFSAYISGLARGRLPKAFIAPGIFFLGGAISYFIGSSWGTWGLLMPLAFTLGTETGTAMPLLVGAVFSGGIFGAFTSPLSDNTASLCTIMEMPLIEYSHTKLVPSLTAAALSLILFALFSR